MNEKKQIVDAHLKCGYFGAIFFSFIATASGLFVFDFGQVMSLVWFMAAVLSLTPIASARIKALKLAKEGCRVPWVKPLYEIRIPKNEPFKSVFVPLEERPPRLFPQKR
ncbi:hypothetical protein RGU75_02280 [Glaciimonas sp. CA11.2]|uniref:hypothetical protein n=1 Tax=Glaciimonas sp. CA11.2 TaxID=3048601 RepID=UPI002AB55783|nr:hypothetical protein [Glaciimonas sp. CA11.2]MDY7545060.1 hypothetical protein [Glaciimonas sp. CA11.2]